MSATVNGVVDLVCPQCRVTFRVTAAVSLPPIAAVPSQNIAPSNMPRSFASALPKLRPRSEREYIKMVKSGQCSLPNEGGFHEGAE